MNRREGFKGIIAKILPKRDLNYKPKLAPIDKW